MAPHAHIISLNRDDNERPRTATADKCFEHRGMNSVRHMNDLVAVRHLKLMKLNVLSIKLLSKL